MKIVDIIINYIALSDLLCFGIVGIMQWRNWYKFRDGNGADTQRIWLMVGNIAAIGTAVCMLFRSWIGIAIFISLVPIVGFKLYKK